ncbi:MAG: twin-arginine translocase TatA/TatE family subunit [Nitriliruptoraceae bacterium]
MGLGTTELVIILLIVLVLFGAKRLPGLASSIGTSIKEFRSATNEPDEDGGTRGDPGAGEDRPRSDHDPDSGR